MSLNADTARNTVRPGDLVVTDDGDVIRAAEVDGKEGFLGVQHVADGAIRELAAVPWEDVDKYHPREDTVDVATLLEHHASDDQDGADEIPDERVEETIPPTDDQEDDVDEDGGEA